MSDYLDPNNEELLKDFFMEAELQVDMLEQNILTLENDPGNREAVDEIFRAAHTLKGASATVQMDELTGFTHIVEDVLDDIRSDKLSVTEDVVDALLNAIDITKSMLEARSNGGIFEEDVSHIKDILTSFLGKSDGSKKKSQPENKSTPVPESQPVQAENPKISEYELLEMKDAIKEGESIFQVSVLFNEDNPMNSVGGIQVFAALKKVGTVLKTEPEFDELYKDQFFPEVVYFVGASLSEPEIQEKLHIPDVILSVTVSSLEGSSSGDVVSTPSKAPVVIPEPVSAAPAQESIPEPVIETTAPAYAEEPDSSPEDTHQQVIEKRTAEVKKNLTGSVLRVDASRIDNLLNLVSEAVITKASFNQINSIFNEILLDMQTVDSRIQERLNSLFTSIPVVIEEVVNGKSAKDAQKELMASHGDVLGMLDPVQAKLKNAVGRFRNTSQSLARTTTELQEGVMQIRMVPIAQIFNRFPRLVRDVSKNLDKKIRLLIEGEDTELDKSVIDDLLDPLIHCVRNSADHGVETPEERIAKGKPEEGTVLLRASNEGNMIVIEIIDDGAGIDVDAVRQKAIERGVIHPSKILSDVEAFNLIFEPGFSTAKKVTNISGRGVGLDVVKKQIEKLNGNVSVWSEVGKGSKTTIKLPLTLAIIQGLLVKVGEETYAIPITSVMDSHRIKPSDIKLIDNYEVFNVRDEAVSLLRLSRLFKIPTEDNGDYKYVVLVGSEEKKMGLMVDTLIGEEDVVIKPLKDKYTNSPGIAGATILGDGTVSLIMDISQLLELGFKEEMAERQRRVASIM
ncbi:MAG: chemotaxis protein CheA [Spirochaetales bacterium]|nr:chemotaxis protein CheA [Spirochaetales bacterium]